MLLSPGGARPVRPARIAHPGKLCIDANPPFSIARPSHTALRTRRIRRATNRSSTPTRHPHFPRLYRVAGRVVVRVVVRVVGCVVGCVVG